MKLQKLMFFAQSWYFKQNGCPLIDDNFVRWKYGPVLPSVYYEFSSVGGNPITNLAKNSEGEEVTYNLSIVDNKFLDDILEEYGSFDGWKLSVMTHQPKTAWSKGNIGSVITPQEMIVGEV